MALFAIRPRERGFDRTRVAPDALGVAELVCGLIVDLRGEQRPDEGRVRRRRDDRFRLVERGGGARGNHRRTIGHAPSEPLQRQPAVSGIEVVDDCDRVARFRQLGLVERLVRPARPIEPRRAKI